MKTCFISGASRGIGKAIAKQMAMEGYHLALCCHTSKDLLDTFANELIETYHIQVLTYCGDIGSPSFVSTMGEDILMHFPHIDVVINNAGIAHIGLITDMTEDQWNTIVATNLSSCFYTTKAFVPQMIQRKSGQIINISSMWGRVGASCEVAYSATKGGINSYTMALAKELAPSGISVNAIACGFIDTEMNQMLDESERQIFMEDIPCNRFGLPEDVARTVSSLLSGSTYLTGQVIGLDGGYI